MDTMACCISRPTWVKCTMSSSVWLCEAQLCSGTRPHSHKCSCTPVFMQSSCDTHKSAGAALVNTSHQAIACMHEPVVCMGAVGQLIRLLLSMSAHVYIAQIASCLASLSRSKSKAPLGSTSCCSNGIPLHPCDHAISSHHIQEEPSQDHIFWHAFNK